jgi:hypothetical protein
MAELISVRGVDGDELVGAHGEPTATSAEKKKVGEGTEGASKCLQDMVDHTAVQHLTLLQAQALAELRETTDSLSSFNEMSESAYRTVKQKFVQHTKVVAHIKTDLHVVLARIRTIRKLLNDKFDAGLDLHTGESSDSDDEGDCKGDGAE